MSGRSFMRAGLLLVVLAGGLLACSKEAEQKSNESADSSARRNAPSVYAVNYPLSYFAERIAPEGTRVVFPVPAGLDPAFWKPSAEEIEAFQRADLILLNGAGYARWTRYATLPATRVLVTADGCRERFLKTGDAVRHQHGPAGEHAHDELAFTTWLDLRLAVCQANHIRDALLERMPKDESEISNRFESLQRDLLALDARLRKAGEAAKGLPVLASHPVYQYLANAYGLSIRSLHWEPSERLDEEAWKELEAMLDERPSKWMLWEAAPLPSTLEGLRARGVSALLFEPAGNAPQEGDFLSVMQANVERLECASGAKVCR